MRNILATHILAARILPTRTLTALAAFALVTAGSLSANAQMRSNSSIRGILGFSSGSVNIGADYEMKKTNLFGLGGYFFLGTGDDGGGSSVQVADVLALGAFAPIHIVNDYQLDVYIAPGFGFAKIEVKPADETTFGPTVKIGAEFAVAPTVKVGLQHFIITNWLSDELGSEITYTNASATFSF